MGVTHPSSAEVIVLTAGPPPGADLEGGGAVAGAMAAPAPAQKQVQGRVAQQSQRSAAQPRHSAEQAWASEHWWRGGARTPHTSRWSQASPERAA